jgi:hypothetical protein
MPCPSHPPWLDHSNYVWRGVHVMKPLVMQFSPVTSSLFGPNILLSTLFSNILSLCSSFNVRDHISHPYRTTVKIIIFLYSNLYVFRLQMIGQKSLDWMVTNITRILSVSSSIKFWFLTVVHRYLNCATFSKVLLAIFMLWFCPAFWWRYSNIYLVFSAFTSRPISSLASIRVSVLWYLCYLPVDSHHLHRPAADVSHLISVPPSFPGPS